MSGAALESVPTLDEFLAWETEQPERWEFIDGEAFAMAGGSDIHNTICLNAAFALRERLRGSPCSVFMGDVKLRIGTADAVFYPDVFVTCDEADRTRRHVKQAPRLIVEVLSPSTEAYDRGRKFESYRRSPTLEVLIFLSQDRAHAECYTRASQGGWLLTEVSGTEGTLAVDVFGFELPLIELYRDLPDRPDASAG